MNDKDIRDQVTDFYTDEANRGVGTVAEVSQLLGVDEQAVRAHARANDLRRVGAQFVFGEEDAHDLVDALEDAEAEEDDEDPDAEGDEDPDADDDE
jgi:hypothetical protein